MMRRPLVGFFVTLAIWLACVAVVMPPIGTREVVIGVLVAGALTLYLAREQRPG